jgi:hypothetical protein
MCKCRRGRSFRREVGNFNDDPRDEKDRRQTPELPQDTATSTVTGHSTPQSSQDNAPHAIQRRKTERERGARTRAARRRGTGEGRPEGTRALSREAKRANEPEGGARREEERQRERWEQKGQCESLQEHHPHHTTRPDTTPHDTTRHDARRHHRQRHRSSRDSTGPSHLVRECGGPYPNTEPDTEEGRATHQRLKRRTQHSTAQHTAQQQRGRGEERGGEEEGRTHRRLSD